jgi:hypothetical protein
VGGGLVWEAEGGGGGEKENPGLNPQEGGMQHSSYGSLPRKSGDLTAIRIY